MKTEAKKRRDRRLYMRQYREEKATANAQRHPTLSNEELAAVEEAMALDTPRIYSHISAQVPMLAPTDKERDALKAFALQQEPKPADQDLEFTIRIPTPTDLPNGIIR